MGQAVQVDYKRPLRVAKQDGEVTIVKNITGPTVYYKSGQAGEAMKKESFAAESLANVAKILKSAGLVEA